MDTMRHYAIRRGLGAFRGRAVGWPLPAALGGAIALRAARIAARLAVWVVVGLFASGFAAAQAAAGWSPATPVENGVDPTLAFGPSGDAAIGASQLSRNGQTVATFLALRLPHRRFSPPQRFGHIPKPDRGFSPAGLQAIALPSDGAAVALLAPAAGGLGPVDAFVKPPGAAGFGTAQQIVKVGDVNGDSYSADTTTVVDTTRGEVVEAGQDSNSNLSTATLARGSTRFVVARSTPAGMANTDTATLATDAAGDTPEFRS